jgi:hypothetical protein
LGDSVGIIWFAGRGPTPGWQRVGVGPRPQTK